MKIYLLVRSPVLETSKNSMSCIIMVENVNFLNLFIRKSHTLSKEKKNQGKKKEGKKNYRATSLCPDKSKRKVLINRATPPTLKIIINITMVLILSVNKISYQLINRRKKRRNTYLRY